MQWGHIKTLFILSFLILNIYLVTAFIDRQQDVGYLDNRELPIEEQFASENITYDNIEVEVEEAAYISVVQKVLTDEDFEMLQTFENQEIRVIQNSFIVSEFKEPIVVPDTISQEEIQTAIQNNFLYGEEYDFWNFDEEMNVLIFFQTKEDRPIYYNENGVLLIYLNEDKEMTHYTQTVLGEAEIQGNPIVLNQPIQVISTLFRGNYLNNGDEITDLDIGYYSRIVAEGAQVFAPTWEVEVNKERSHYVNAIEGIIYENDEKQFLEEMINLSENRLTELHEDDDVRKSLERVFEDRTERQTE